MRNPCRSIGALATLAFFVLTAKSLAATPPPLAGLHYLVGGTWNCTYRAGAVRFSYDATYAYDRGGHALREIASWKGGGDEELIAFDPHRGKWTAVVLDDQGTATVMRATGSDPSHVAYRSVYPDSTLAVRFDRGSAAKYTLHASVRAGGKTMNSVDTCLRAAH